jgi:N-methylhydantoinase A/oxoprolinase/acetone carboxylase beta subunit
LRDAEGCATARVLTVTDVNLALGRVAADRFPFELRLAPVLQALDENVESLARAGFERTWEEVAAGYFEIANAGMAQAIIEVSVERGADPRDHVLVGFGGAGGQHVNRTESAVRITHLPSNIVVQCQNDRSQHKNKATAMKQLKARLYELELQNRRAKASEVEDSKADVGWGSQIRSYVLDQSRIKDLRTNMETGNIQSVLDGNLDFLIEASLKQGL